MDGLMAETTALYLKAFGPLSPVRVTTFRRMPLTPPRIRMLFLVRDQPGMTVTALAEAIGISLPATSQQISELVDLGLLRRGGDPDDRRRLSLELTVEGEQAAAAIQQGAEESVIRVLSKLGPADLAEFHRILAVLFADAPDAAVHANPGGASVEHLPRSVTLHSEMALGLDGTQG